MANQQEFNRNTPKPEDDSDADLLDSIIEHLNDKICEGTCSRDDSGIEVYEEAERRRRCRKLNP